MTNCKNFFSATVASVVTLLGGVAQAQYTEPEERTLEERAYEEQQMERRAGQSEESARRDYVFLEALGGYGVQLGDTDYLPDGGLDEFKHPLVHGWVVGGTIGFLITEQIAIVGNYEYTDARSREGDVDMVLDKVKGNIDYHTITAGVRIFAPVGFGRFYAELGLGIALPHSTRVNFDYNPALEQVGITGRGQREENFDVGYGGHGALGYQFPIAGPLYGGLDLKIKAFQSENRGETTELRNFVTDFEETPPTAVTTEIRHGDGAARPITSAISEARLRLSLGLRF